MTSSSDRLAVVLAQPATWTTDGAANLAAVREEVRLAGPFGDDHVLVLPELVGATMARSQYVHELRAISAVAGSWVVGGSHYGTAGPLTNAGVVLDPAGHEVDHYEKRNPYGIEHAHGVQPGDRHATFDIGGRTVTVMICADAWFAELLLDAPRSADLVVVPSFSITRRPPAFARALWQHLAVARAYEFTAFVAVADWRQGASYHGAPSAGVSGIADPFPTDPDRYYVAAAPAPLSVHELDLGRLDRLRVDRRTRGFSRVGAPE
jgi:predicted amidohydrolase